MISYKIFQIGFNKCATVSLTDFFASGLPPNTALHHIIPNKGSSLVEQYMIATFMYENKRKGNKILDGIDEFIYYGDMQTVHDLAHVDLYKDLDAQYPGSKFILNLRPIDKWITSRLRHRIHTYRLYIDVEMELYNKSKDEIVNMWKNTWHNHIADVKKHFENRPNDLLVFDIENDNVEKIKTFFNDIKFGMNTLPRSNQT